MDITVVRYPVLLDLLVDMPCMPPPRDGGSDPTNVGGNITRGNSQTSRVAYLKRSYSTQQISESASRLLLTSW